jgi:hypothetical protein|tara:strand:- start:416 stop:964 length:549 start_codon:yes stop_codon:yes gene_type:complete
MATNKDPLGDFMTEKDAAQEARMKKINPKGRKLDKNGNPIITKEELTKSGMTLREFMNNERKLTARADSPKKAAPTKDILAPMQGPAVKATPAAAQKDTYDRVMRDEARKRDAAPPSRGNVERETGNKMRKIIEEQAEKERMSTYPKGSGMKHGGSVKGMKHGGSVRGDGIAVKGKTKGRMV